MSNINNAKFYKVPLNNNNFLEEALKELDIWIQY